MGYFRFHRSARIAPGLQLNLSRSGPSLSVGAPGATLNVSENELRYTSSLPGTGLSHIERTKKSSGRLGRQDQQSSSAMIDQAMDEASALSDKDLRANLKDAMFDSTRHHQVTDAQEKDDAQVAKWQVQLLRAELDRRSRVKSTTDVRRLMEAILSEADSEDVTRAEPLQPAASLNRVQGPSKLMVIVGGLLAGWRLGKRI